MSWEPPCNHDIMIPYHIGASFGDTWIGFWQTGRLAAGGVSHRERLTAGCLIGSLHLVQIPDSEVLGVARGCQRFDPCGHKSAASHDHFVGVFLQLCDFWSQLSMIRIFLQHVKTHCPENTPTIYHHFPPIIYDHNLWSQGICCRSLP